MTGPLQACQDAGECAAEEEAPLTHGNAALEEKGADLIDDAGALADQALTHAV